MERTRCQRCARSHECRTRHHIRSASLSDKAGTPLCLIACLRDQGRSRFANRVIRSRDLECAPEFWSQDGLVLFDEDPSPRGEPIADHRALVPKGIRWARRRVVETGEASVPSVRRKPKPESRPKSKNTPGSSSDSYPSFPQEDYNSERYRRR